MKAFQSQKGLSVTGVINSVTLEALFPAKEVQTVTGTSAPRLFQGTKLQRRKTDCK
ncbi:peptidoglycan-binding protein [Ochrobactrum daejeonense]|nr:peptidoglycan-binding protein [Brucella daejeonensis]